MNLFDLCERGNHYYNTKEYDRALYYYNLAINKGYDGLQIIQRAQRLKDMGVVPKPPIDVGKARQVIKIKQEDWRQFVFVKANYPEKLIASLKSLVKCTIKPSTHDVENTEQVIYFKTENVPVMMFLYKDKKNMKTTCQFITEMEKYYKTTIVDGKKIKMPAKRKKYHFVIVYDTFTDLLLALQSVKLFDQVYYEEHRQELLDKINDEFGDYRQVEIKTLSLQFISWLETFSIIHHLARTHDDLLEKDYLKEYIHESLSEYISLVEKEPIYRIDYFYFLMVFLEKLYKKYPAEKPDKFEFIYEKYLVCRKFNETFGRFIQDISENLITEPVLHEFSRFINQFRKDLFK
ncbi:MAG: hypothetical protein ACTSVI_06230 [Promethearchaeota archaeon]